MMFCVDKRAHASDLIHNLPRQLEDSWLETEKGEQVPFHSVMLGAASPVLQTTPGPGFTVPRVCKETLSAVRSYLYQPGSFIPVTADWKEIMRLASYLQMSHIVNGTLDPGFILDSMHNMYYQKNHAYFLVRSGGEEFPCHAAVLAASSPVMREQVVHIVSGQPAPSVPSLTLSEGNPRATRVLLDFIYSGELELHADHVFELFELSVVYQYDVVIRMCKTYIAELVSPGCAVEFYHKVQDIEGRHHTTHTWQLMSTLHTWITLNFTEIITHNESLCEMTESDWIEFLPQALLPEWMLDDIINAAFQWYKQKPKERASQLLCIVASINAQSNKCKDQAKEESTQQLEATLASSISEWKDGLNINPEGMEQHRRMFQQHQMYLQNLKLSEHLHDKLASLQQQHNVCSDEVQQHVDRERQRVIQSEQDCRQLRATNDTLMEMMKQWKVQLTLQHQQMEMEQQLLQKQQAQHQKDQSAYIARGKEMQKKIEQQKNEYDVINEKAKGLTQMKEKQEKEEKALSTRQKDLENQFEKQGKEEVELKKKLDVNREWASKQQAEEKNLNQKEKDLDERKRENEGKEAKQQAEEKKLNQKKKELDERKRKHEAQEAKLKAEEKLTKQKLEKIEELKREIEKLEEKKRLLEEELKNKARGSGHEDKSSPSYRAEQAAAIDQILKAKNDYDVLGVRRGAKTTDIMSAFRQLSKLIHPDKCKHPRSNEAMTRLNGAKTRLLTQAYE